MPIPEKTLAFWKGREEEGPGPGGFLIPVDCTPTPGQRYHVFREAFENAFAELGLPPHRHHDTRHTTASLLHAAGVEPYTVKKILGHAAQDVTEKVYTHISDDQLREAIDKI